MKLKYIIASHNRTEETVTVFSEEIVHTCIADGIRNSARWATRNWSNAFASAGFCTIEAHNGVVVVEAFGGSESMGLRARPEDAAIIAKHLGLGEAV